MHGQGMMTPTPPSPPSPSRPSMTSNASSNANANVKRAACDRCHGQKMRCIREQNRLSCNRCLAAGSACVFSIARKAGRPPASRTKQAVRSQQQHHQQQQHQQQQQQQQYISELDSLLEMESRAQISEGMETSTAAALPPYSPMSMSTIPGLELEMYGSEALWTDDGRGLEMDMDILHQGTGIAEGSFGIDSSPRTEQEQDPESNVLPPTENAMEQLSALSGRLLGHVQALSTTPTELSPINDSAMPQLQQLAANVIESSVAFHRILSTAQRSLLDGLDPTGSLVTDTAAILQILAAYIRLTQLHYALYQRVRCILRFTRDSPCTESSDPDLDSTTAPFPSLHIGGVSLSAYPRFQLKFLLQICVHHLGEVEALLGLPAGFCVSERVVESRGILAQGAGEMPLLVLSIMRQAEQTVKSIRSVLAELAEETRGRIVV